MDKEMRMLTQDEFELLKLLQTSPKLKTQQFSSPNEFNKSCDLAIQLLQKGYLYSKKLNIYNDDDPIKFDCLASNFHVTIKTINAVVCYENYDAYTKATPSSFSFNFLGYAFIAIVVIGSLGFILSI